MIAGIARWLIRRGAAWQPEAQRQEFQDESFDLIDSYAGDGLKLRALLLGLTEVRRSAWSFGVPSWLLSEQSDRLGIGLVFGLLFGPAYGFIYGPLSGLFFGLFVWLFVGLFYRQGRGRRYGPRYGLFFGLVGLIIGLGFWLGTQAGLGIALLAGLNVFLPWVVSWYVPIFGRWLMKGVRRRIPQP